MKVINKKQDLEYYMRISYSKYERFAYQQKINNLNFEYCQDYNKLKNRIN